MKLWRLWYKLRHFTRLGALLGRLRPRRCWNCRWWLGGYGTGWLWRLCTIDGRHYDGSRAWHRCDSWERRER